MFNRVAVASSLIFLLLIASSLTSGCLRRFSDTSSDPYGEATFGGKLLAASSSGPARAIIDSGGINSLLIYAVDDDESESVASRIYPAVNPVAQTFTFANQRSGNYTLTVVQGSGSTKSTYRAKIYVTSTYDLFLGDLQLVGGLLSANVYKVDAETPSSSPMKLGCQFNSSGYISSTSSDVGGSFSTLAGTDNVAGFSTVVNDLMTVVTDSATSDISSIASILSRGTRTLSGTITLASLSGDNIYALDGPSFTLQYGADSGMTTTDISQGSSIYMKMTTSPAITAVKLYAQGEVFDSTGALISRASSATELTASDGVYTYDTDTILTDSGSYLWSNFSRASSIRMNITLVNNDTTSSSQGGCRTEYASITVLSTPYDLPSLTTVPVIDGAETTDEWPSSTLIITDDGSDGTDSGTDILKLYTARDSSSLYCRLDLNSETFLTDGTTYAIRLGVKPRSDQAMPIMINGEYDLRIRYDSGWSITVVKNSDQTAVSAVGATAAVGSTSNSILECQVGLSDLGISLTAGDVLHIGAYIFSGTSYATGASTKDSTLSKLIKF